jgi:ureidoglycolate hydrolase
MTAPVAKITPTPLDERSWAPFGWVPVADTDPSDGTHRLEFTWDDVHVNRIAHRRDEVPAVPGGLRCQMLFRHATHTQVLMPLDVASVVVVAPADVPFTSASDAASATAFVLQPLQAVVLHRGTWHWGPFPIGAESVELFNVQGLRYAEDNERADLEVLGASVDVSLD